MFWYLRFSIKCGHSLIHSSNFISQPLTHHSFKMSPNISDLFSIHSLLLPSKSAQSLFQDLILLITLITHQSVAHFLRGCVLEPVPYYLVPIHFSFLFHSCRLQTSEAPLNVLYTVQKLSKYLMHKQMI